MGQEPTIDPDPDVRFGWPRRISDEQLIVNFEVLGALSLYCTLVAIDAVLMERIWSQLQLRDTLNADGGLAESGGIMARKDFKLLGEFARAQINFSNNLLTTVRTCYVAVLEDANEVDLTFTGFSFSERTGLHHLRSSIEPMILARRTITNDDVDVLTSLDVSTMDSIKDWLHQDRSLRARPLGPATSGAGGTGWSTYGEARAWVSQVHGEIRAALDEIQTISVDIGKDLHGIVDRTYMVGWLQPLFQHFNILMDALGDGDWVCGDMILNDIHHMRAFHCHAAIIENFADAGQSYAMSREMVTKVADLAGTERLRAAIQEAHDQALAYVEWDREKFITSYRRLLKFWPSLVSPDATSREPWTGVVPEYSVRPGEPRDSSSFPYFAEFLKTVYGGESAAATVQLGPSAPTALSRDYGGMDTFDPYADRPSDGRGILALPDRIVGGGQGEYAGMRKTMERAQALESLAYNTMFGLTVVGSSWNDYLSGYIALSSAQKACALGTLWKVRAFHQLVRAFRTYVIRTRRLMRANPLAVVTSEAIIVAARRALRWRFDKEVRGWVFFFVTFTLAPALYAFLKNQHTLLENLRRYLAVADSPVLAKRLDERRVAGPWGGALSELLYQVWPSNRATSGSPRVERGPDGGWEYTQGPYRAGGYADDRDTARNSPLSMQIQETLETAERIGRARAEADAEPDTSQ